MTLPTRTLGRTGIELPTLGFGSASLGNMYRAQTEDGAMAAVEAAYRGGIRYFDTTPLYGFGLAEHCMGAALGSACFKRTASTLDASGKAVLRRKL